LRYANLLLSFLLLFWTTATVTAYTPYECGGNRITASGKEAQEYITLAASDHIPLGTEVYIPSRGWGVVEDRMNSRYNRKYQENPRIDIFMEEPQKAKEWGRKEIQIYIGGKTDESKPNRTLYASGEIRENDANAENSNREIDASDKGTKSQQPRTLREIIRLYLTGFTGIDDTEKFFLRLQKYI